MAAVGLDAGGAVDDGCVADIGYESLRCVEVEQAVLVLLLWRSLAPPASKPCKGWKINNRWLSLAQDISEGCVESNFPFPGENQRYRIIFHRGFCRRTYVCTCAYIEVQQERSGNDIGRRGNRGLVAGHANPAHIFTCA